MNSYGARPSRSLPCASFPSQGKALATSCIEFFGQLNRRTLDQLMSKFFFYWVRLHEASGDDTGALRP